MGAGKIPKKEIVFRGPLGKPLLRNTRRAWADDRLAPEGEEHQFDSMGVTSPMTPSTRCVLVV